MAGETPKYDQDFFLALALKGKDEWNKWRRDPANNDVRVTFEGVDFSEAPRNVINFEGFVFGDFADFSKCKWRGVNWNEIQNDPRTFAPGHACFIGAIFGDEASFAGAAFGGEPRFDGAAFGDLVSFNGAAFGGESRFDGATFGNEPSFDGAAFGGGARFAGAAFGNGASFDNAHFKGRVEFTGMSEEQWTKKVVSQLVSDAEARQTLEKRHKDIREAAGSRLDRFFTISFSRARFDGIAVFSGRSFEKTADFTNARFYSPPDFEWCGGTARIDFTGAYIGFARPGRLHWTKDTEVLLRLRSFRKIAEETKNHDLERDLYIEERKAERGVYLVQRFKEKKWALFAHVLWIIVMGVYWALADYGRSFARPIGWLIASGFFFYWCYGKILASLAPKACPVADQYDQAVRMLALGNTVPFVGPLTIDSKIKDFLFCPLNNCSAPIIPPEGYQLAVLSQNLLSIILVFFIGLALRNYFKIK